MPGLMTKLRGGASQQPVPQQPQPGPQPTGGGGMGMMVGQQPGTGAQPQQQGLQQQTDDSGGPQSDQASKLFEANTLNAIYNKSTLPALLSMLKGGGNPVDALAQAASQVVLRVQQSATQSNIQAPMEAVLRAGAVAITDIAALSAQNGGHKFSDQEIQQAFLKGADLYRVALQRAGQLDPAEWKQKFGEMQQAEQSGELEKTYPGMREAVQQMQARGQDSQKSAPNMQQSMQGENEGPSETMAEGGQEEPGDMKAPPAPAQGQFKKPGMRQKAKKGK